METVGSILFVLAAVLAIEWTIAYHVKTRGGWRDTPMGRHAMAFMGALAAVLSLGAIRDVSVNFFGTGDPLWFEILRLVVSTSIPGVILWRRVLLSRAQKEQTTPDR